MLGDEPRAPSSRSSGVFRANGRHALQGALGQADQRAGRRELDEAGDAQLASTSPCTGPSGPGWLTWLTMRREDSRPPGTTGAVGVGQRGARVVGRHRRGPGRRAPSTAGAMWTVWNAPATLSGMTRALAGGSAAKAASWSEGAGGDDLARTVHVGRGEAVLGRWRRPPRRGPRRGPRTCRSAVDGAGLGHRATTQADQPHRVLGVRDPRGGGRGDLPDQWPATAPTERERVGRVREQRERGEQPGGDDERLGDGGVADRVGVGVVPWWARSSRRRRTATRPRAQAGELEPGGQEAGGLGALAGADETSTLHSLGSRGRGRASGATKLRGDLCRNPTRLSGSGARPAARGPARAGREGVARNVGG